MEMNGENQIILFYLAKSDSSSTNALFVVFSVN
jgi:hypothetical protein